LAYLNPPATAGCLPSHTNLGSTGNPWTPANKSLTPGNYCGTGGFAAINITNTAGVTMAAGTYMINGGGAANSAAPANGGLYASGAGSGADIAGTGVTLYFYNGATLFINTFVSFGGIHLTAPSPPAAYAGILVYQDRADTSLPTIGGFFTLMDLEGAFYVPNSTLTFQQFLSAQITHDGIYVAKDIVLKGVIGTLQDYTTATGSGGSSPIKSTVLVE